MLGASDQNRNRGKLSPMELAPQKLRLKRNPPSNV